MDKLKGNQWYFWLGGLLPVVLMGILQVPIYRVFSAKGWSLLSASFLSVFMGILWLAYLFWAVLYTLPKEGESCFWKRFCFSSALLLSAYLLPVWLIGCLRAKWLGAYLSIGIYCSLILLSLPIVLMQASLIPRSRRIVAAILCGAYLGVYGAGIAVAAKAKVEKLVVVQDFFVQDTMPKGEGQKIKVVLLNGQSNAAGTTRMSYLRKNASAEDFARYQKGYDNVMINYFDGNGKSTSGGAFVRVSTAISETSEGLFGPELGMADVLSAAFPDETIYIVKYAWGGTNLYEQWLSPSSEGETGELYTAFVNFTTECLEYLRSKNYDPEIYAMCWMQGESDADEIHADAYGERSANLVKDVRKEFAKYACDGGITFIDAGISDSDLWVCYDKINQAKVANAAKEDSYLYIDTIAAGLSYRKEPEESPDRAHYDALSMIELGRLFGGEVEKVLKK